MINKKEILAILVATLILGFTLSLVKTTKLFLYACLLIFLIILINLVAKKIMAHYVEAGIETKIWEVQQYGIRKQQHFKKPFPAGVFAPIFFTVLSLGNLTWFAPLVFEVKPKKHRAVRRHGPYSYSEMTEAHIGLIATAGIIANLIFAIIGYLVNIPEFSRLNIYFAAFNLIPISNLDGNKIFFGNFKLWTVLVIIIFIALAYSIFLI